MLFMGNIRNSRSIIDRKSRIRLNSRIAASHCGRGVTNIGAVHAGIPRWNGFCHPADGMDEKQFQTKLAELMGEISTLPAGEREKLRRLSEEARHRQQQLQQTVNNLQESMDYLRLSIKYLVFDLEATRRENGYLRKMLDESRG